MIGAPGCARKDGFTSDGTLMRARGRQVVIALSFAACLSACSFVSGDGETPPSTASSATTATGVPEPSVSAASGSATASTTPTASASTASPSSTSTAGTDQHHSDADAVRESLYLDEWVKSIARAFDGMAASLYTDSGPGGGRFSSLEDAFAYMEGFTVPAGFEVSYETMVEGTYVVAVWHPQAWTYQTEITAFTSRKGPLTPTSTLVPFRENPETAVDTATAEALWEVLIRVHSSPSGDDGPTDDQLRQEGVLLDGQEWSIEYNPADATHFILRVWNEAGYLFDSKEHAAYFDSYARNDYRPEANFAIDRFWNPVTAPGASGDPDRLTAPAHSSTVPPPTPTEGAGR